METNRRALYNSLRMNWIHKPTLDVEPWQVEDYRAMPTDELFERLGEHEIFLEKSSFLIFADEMNSPEEMTETLIAESVDAQSFDQVYLVIFELWRRLLPENPCLSIFCDELDHQIYLFDQGDLQSLEQIEDVLANLQVVLNENTDEGADPHDAFNCLCEYCANDIEVFLHDFISEQIDTDNLAYASELLDGFEGYVQNLRWFEFLRARLVAATNPNQALNIVKKLIKDKKSEADLEFNFEVLFFLVIYGDKETFDYLVVKTAELIEVEEDFQSLLSVCVDFYHRLDQEMVEKSLQKIFEARSRYALEKPFSVKDPHLVELLKILATT